MNNHLLSKTEIKSGNKTCAGFPYSLKFFKSHMSANFCGNKYDEVVLLEGDISVTTPMLALGCQRNGQL